MPTCTPTIVMYEPVDEKLVEEVVESVQRVYSVECPGYVELVFHAKEDVRAEDVNVDVEYETGFYYEAYEDIPRIHVVAEKALRMPGSLRRAMAVHEAVHSVLHPSREYYIAPGGDPLLYHAVFTTVKDLEVHLWMARRGFQNELRVLREYWDAVSPECALPEEVMDEARRLTVYVALGEEPRLNCGPISRALYELLVKLAACEPRPWACRFEAVEVFRKLVL